MAPSVDRCAAGEGLLTLHGDLVPPGDLGEDAHTLRDDLRTDPVSGNDRDELVASRGHRGDQAGDWEPLAVCAPAAMCRGESST